MSGKIPSRELTGEQRRQLIDTQQVHEAWLDAEDERQRRFVGSMRWVSRNGVDYLLRKIKQTETSLGPRSDTTERTFIAFTKGRERNKDLLAGLSNRLDTMAKINLAMGLGRVPLIAARILRNCTKSKLLGRQLFVVGTNSLFAYEALAGVHISSDLVATGDIDLLYDSRSRISLISYEKLTQAGLIGILRKVDQSFKPVRPRAFRAINRDGYMVDLIRPQPKDILAETSSTSVTPNPDDLDGAPIEGLHWLINAPKVDSIAIDERGYPVKIATVDPRAFAVHKAWLASKPDRSPLKSTRDREQSVLVAQLAKQYLRLEIDAEHLGSVPIALRNAAQSLLNTGVPSEKNGEASVAPNW